MRTVSSKSVTNVSETTRKASLAEAQTALGKRNTFSWNDSICPIAVILRVTASLRKISLKSANRLLRYYQKNDYQYGGRPLF